MKALMRIKVAWFWLVIGVVILAACSSGNAANGTPQSLMTQAPGGMMGSTPGAVVTNTGAIAFDQMFINMMVPHHQGAVEMAKIAQQRAEHAEIKQMAEQIISSQQEEITQLKGWKQQWYGSSDTPMMSEMPMMEEMPSMGGAGHTMNMQADVDALKNALEPFDLAFIDAMILHHQSAVVTANLALTQANQEALKQMAQKMIGAQQIEIDQLTEWRQAWYPDAPPLATPTP